MARPKKPPNDPPPPPSPRRPNRRGVPVHVYIDPAIREAVRQHIDSHPLKPDLTAVISLALREYLERVGYWPPPPAPEPKRRAGE